MKEFEIKKVVRFKDEKTGYECYILNDELNVPMVKGNRHFDAIEKWIEDGGKVDESME